MKLATALVFSTACLAAFMHANSVNSFSHTGFSNGEGVKVIISSLLLASRANGMPNHETARKRRASLDVNIQTNIVQDMTEGAETVSKIFSTGIYETVAPKLGKH